MIALAVIVFMAAFIAYLKVGIAVLWNDELTVRLIVGPLRFSVLPAKKSPSGASTKNASSKHREKKKQTSPWRGVILSNWQEILELVGRVLHMPVLDPVVLRVTFGGEDPAEGALNYGRAWGIIGSVVPLLESNFRIGRREFDVKYDQNASDIKVYVKGSLTARVWECARLAISAVILFLRLYQQTKYFEKAV